jgi:filamentous hemagglutinin family protein
MQRKIRRQMARRLRQKAAKALWTSVAATGLLLGACGYTLANPTGGEITGGSAAISGEGTKAVTVTQTSNTTTINWTGFSIDSGETVTFIQPGSSSIAVNRVTGTDASAIYGTLTANGKVYLINPNGILFSRDAQVNVGGIVASTLDISANDLLAGNYTFSGSSTATVSNAGTIAATDGGYVVLLGKQVSNSGTISADSGTVVLGAGSQIRLDFDGDGLLGLAVDSAVLGALAKNSGTIRVDGGAVYLSAAAADALTGTVVNNSGTIRAQSVAEVNGTIVLNGGSNGTVANSGILDASGRDGGETGGTVKVLGETVNLADGTSINVSGDAGGGTALIGGNYQGGGAEQHATATTVAVGATINADAVTVGDGGTVVVWSDGTTGFAGKISARGGSESGDGGSVETSGKSKLTVADTAGVNTLPTNGATGEWLLDPADFTIAASGGDMTGVALSVNLETTSVTIISGDGAVNPDGSGDINIEDAISWSADTTLTLEAENDIHINADISSSGGSAGLAMDYGDAGAYSLGAGVSITLSGASAGLTIEGNAYTVINNNNAASLLSGLISSTDSTLLAGYYALGEDLDLTGVPWTPLGSNSNYFTGVFDGLGNTGSNLTISSTNNYIGLFGYSTGTIRNLGLIDPTVSGAKYVGALVGYNGSGGIIENCYVTVTEGSTATVSATSGDVGGLAGDNYGTITHCYNDVDVSSSGSTAGGLVGCNKSLIENSYSTGDVSGTANVGGLVGYMGYSTGTLTNCYATGDVYGSSNYVGGLVGRNRNNPNGSITGCYSTGDVTGLGIYVGGLMGVNETSPITNCYSTGRVTGAGYVGGLTGYNTGAVSDSRSSSDVTLTAGTATNDTWSAGGLIGYNTGNITDCYATGAVVSYNGSSYYGASNLYACVGGLVGYNRSGDITGCYSTGVVTSAAGRLTGGLVGWLYGGTVSGCYHITGAVSGTNSVGGLIGGAGWSGFPSNIIEYCYNTAAVKGWAWVGGLCGTNFGTIRYSYNTGAVSGTGSGYYSFGGLVGINYISGKIEYCYNGGSLDGTSGNYNVGGMIGSDNSAGTGITGCYWSAGNNTVVTVGVGSIDSNTRSTYGASTDTAIYTDTGKVTGLTMAEMMDNSNYSGWDIATTGGSGSIWRIYDGYTYPLLKCFLTTLTVTADDVSKTYDGAAYTGALSGITYTAGDGSDVDSSLVVGDVSYGSESDAGAYTLTGLHSGQRGYDIIYSSESTLTINPKTITVSGFIAADKVYDGMTATMVSGTITNAVDGDDITLTGSFSDKNAGIGKTVTASLSGTDAGNYTITYSDTADITAKALTVSGFSAADKVYDGTAAATVSGTIANAVSGDDLTLTGSFSDKNAGGGKTVTASLSGTDAGNYTIAYSDTADITAKALTVSGFSATDKVYDGTTAATVSGTIINAVSGDDLTLIGSFSDKNADNGKTVTAALTGTDAGNYTITYSDTADITARLLTVSGITAENKTYDGSVTATLDTDGVTFENTVAGDSVSLDVGGAGGTFSDKNAGTDKTVTVSGLTLSGADAVNYILTTDYTTMADITAKTLTVTGFTAADKVYDGTAAATVNGTITNAVSGDDLTLTGSFSDKNAGGGKTVTATLTGTDAGNYTIAYTDTADITAKVLTVNGFSATDKVYDGTTAAMVSGTFANAASGDDIALTGTFANKNAGNGKTVTASLTGADAGNYTVSYTDTADITAKALTVSGFNAADKVYDGTTAATVNGTFTNAVSGDDITLTGIFANKNVGGGKTVTASLSGTDAGNYTVSYTDTADITAKALTVSGFGAVDKVYDGTTAATVGGTMTNAVSGDDLALAGSFSDKNAGSGKTVTAALSGTDAGNYTISYTDTAEITAKALTVNGFSAADKIYDGTTTATVSGTITNAVSGDDLALTGSFSDKNAGSGKTVTASLSGTDAGNYAVNYTDTANITPALLTVTANDATWTIGTDQPEYSVSYNGFVNGETEGVLVGTLEFTPSDTVALGVGEYAVSASGLSSPNYTITYVDGVLTVTRNNDDVYKGLVGSLLLNGFPDIPGRDGKLANELYLTIYGGGIRNDGESLSDLWEQLF